MPSFRAFVALMLPDDARLAAQLDALAACGADLKVSRPDELHLTLAFLGDVPEESAGRLGRAVVSAAHGVAPFELELHGLGAFPNAQAPRVVWAGARPSPALDTLAQRVRDECARAGFPGDPKPFKAHATLARVRTDRNGAALARLLAERRDASLPTFRVAHARLYRSTLGAGGARHDVLAEAKLEA